MLSSVFFADFFPVFFFSQGYMWNGAYFQQSKQLRSPDGKPQGFVRQECDGDAGYPRYIIAEYVDGKRHGHEVRYGRAGDVLGESDWLLGEYQ